MAEVFITRVSKFLPNSPISNDEMEDYLGLVHNSASRAKRIVLRNNGIKQRYYAFDKEGNSTHTNAQLTAEAIEGLYHEHFGPQDMELLSCGTSSPDTLMPSHAVLVHGFLKNRNVEVNCASGNCCAGMNALKFGYLSVKSGQTKNAVCTGSERTSSWMLADKFNVEVEHLEKMEETPILAFKKDFLRFMLSDGAGAFLLEDKPRGPLSLRIDWMEGYSYAHEIETCMYAGCEKDENGEVKPWSLYTPQEWLNESIFAIKQDTKLLDQYILEKGAESLKMAIDKHGISSEEIDYFLPHVSSHYFVEGLGKSLEAHGAHMAPEKWFMNLAQVGNVGAGSIYLMVEELFGSGKLKEGDKILLSVPESARFSYTYALLTVVGA
jgi:3-oxoacyl-[acyl-carrier-protein] synthase-3